MSGSAWTTIVKDEPDSGDVLRKEWGKSLASEMEDWCDPDTAKRGMSVKKLAALLDDAGCKVSVQAIYAWLNGDYSPRPRHQAALARVFGMKVHHLFPIEAA